MINDGICQISSAAAYHILIALPRSLYDVLRHTMAAKDEKEKWFTIFVRRFFFYVKLALVKRFDLD